MSQNILVLLGDGTLTSANVFSAIAAFNIMNMAFTSIPFVMTTLTNAYVSAKRINHFLHASELEPQNHSSTYYYGAPHDKQQQQDTPFEDTDDSYAIRMQDASFAWTSAQQEPTLHDINLQIKAGSLIAITGRVGSGKSSLLQAMFKDCPKQSGSLAVRGRIAYCDQVAWIVNDTIRNNILYILLAS